ncbi:uncharacterized protein LY89DRAFT_177118 [Mollisia scopiformis]|uniref:Zn(2)-C6 fungal-type domain-containing protein n=1 Tax=Mollisia scopiformis TaxID=149040 RepID=A0A194XSH1_MOLSC|nr:uncharacterized protein LY89DRAFT_177118 [Mollisia scopiformis]KUJ23250.1 hypothetical protein LY89DRAFT_177118 [Mollisia scopiformis]
MDCSINLSGIDMNDPETVAVYTRLVRFQSDIFSEEIAFGDPDSSLRRIIHDLAHRLGLEFEFSLLTRCARVTRPIPANPYYTSKDQVFTPSTLNGCDTAGYPVWFYAGAQTGEIDFVAETIVSEARSPATFAYPGLDLSSSKVDNTSLSTTSTSNYASYYGSIDTSPALGLLAGPTSSATSTGKIDHPRAFNNSSVKRSNSAASTCSKNQETVFDARAGQSVSSRSSPSVRRGTMDSTSRESMKAVKAVGACWRCKYLRKTCETSDPCEACPKPSQKSTNTNWGLVGCRRGPFADHLPVIRLCTGTGAKTTIDQDVRSQGESMREGQNSPAVNSDNSFWKAQTKERNDDIESIKAADDPEKKFFELIFGHAESIKCWKPLHRLQ